MKPLNVEFVPARTLRRPIAVAALAAGLALAGIGAGLAQQALESYSKVRDGVDKLHVDIARLQDVLNQANPLRPYHSAAQHAVRIASFPLNAFLAELESADLPGVRVIALSARPGDAAGDSVVEAPAADVLPTYLERLGVDANRGWGLQSVQSDTEFASEGGLLKQNPFDMSLLKLAPKRGSLGGPRRETAKLVWRNAN